MKRRKSLVGAWVSRFIFTTTWTAHTIQRWIPTAAQKLKQRSNFCSKFSSLCLCSRPVQTACRSKANLSQRGKSNRVEGKSLYRFFDTNLAKLHRFQQAEFLPEVYYQAIILTHQDTVQQILGPTLQIRSHSFSFYMIPGQHHRFSDIFGKLATGLQKIY